MNVFVKYNTKRAWLYSLFDCLGIAATINKLQWTYKENPSVFLWHKLNSFTAWAFNLRSGFLCEVVLIVKGLISISKVDTFKSEVK